MYIRTKDGRIAEVKENMAIKRCSENVLRLVYKDNRSICVLSGNDDITKEADTIEELCDEFVGIDKTCENGHQLLRAIPYKCANFWNGGVYGAVWTDKGLIYVAKMNDKGELVLI